MAKTETIHTRIDPELKADVDEILSQLGLTSSDAIKLFYKQVVLNNGLPFEIKLPKYNAVTLAAMEEARKIAKDENYKGYTSIESLRKDLEDAEN
jgi:DNA-damage-inducible protein J